MRMKTLMSSACMTWRTPSHVLDVVRTFSPIGLDPCGAEDSLVRAAVEWRLERDGDSLKRAWAGFGLVFCNPPYGRKISEWVNAAAQVRKGGEVDDEVIMLVPARTDTSWFRDVWKTADGICFWNGRIRFVGSNNGAPFPSCLIYWGLRIGRFAKVFSESGRVVVL